ncbi:MAG: SLBB domain-containing protein [Desulfurococcales archaeon]|nr:SLBB domain-containing protein [Desulfurococcales archaeon]
MSWTLMDKCCPKCWHNPPSNPCPKYIECRVKGPLCHDSSECRELRARRLNELMFGRHGIKVRVALASCTLAVGAADVYDAVQEFVRESGLAVDVDIVGCHGLDFIDPWIEVVKKGLPPAIYANVNPEEVSNIVSRYLSGDVSKAFAIKYRTGAAEGEFLVPTLNELEFWRKQVRLVGRNCGIINPESIEEYVARGGYLGLVRAIKKGPDEVIEEIKLAKLRGRGGAGFPTWIKWKTVKDQVSDVKYVVANAEEGDPSAFSNRLLIESDPHIVIEGMIIAGYVTGANKGYVFVGAEFDLAAERLKKAVEEARKYGLLGDNVLGSGFSFDVEVFQDAGRYTSGEETALFEEIEGKRSSPRVRPPYPVSRGLWGKPTVVNNVETLAHAAVIMREGWDRYSTIGTEKSGGTKMVSVSGSVRRPGVYEVPVGTSVKTIIDGLAGGPPEGVKLKAIEVGGPAGGFLPASEMNVPLDYDELPKLGVAMGSGILIAIDEHNCIVDLARQFMAFFVSESCGKCVPCRVGTREMLEILNKICCGKSSQEDLELLQELGETLKNASLCALGSGAPIPVLSTIRYFREEYLAHIIEKRCPTGTCPISREVVKYER